MRKQEECGGWEEIEDSSGGIFQQNFVFVKVFTDFFSVSKISSL